MACTGTSPNLTAPTWNDVGINASNCHGQAVNGDTITVTPGSYTVTLTTQITKQVTLNFQSSTLTDNTADTVSMIDIVESTAGSIKIIGGTVLHGTANHSSPSGVIKVNANAGGQPVLVTGITATGYTGGNFMYWAPNRGVVWNNSMTGVPSGGPCFNNTSFIRHKPNDGTRETPPTYGSADTNGDKHLYVEHNTLYDVLEWFDADDDARAVIRFNTITNSGITHHGDSSPGARYTESYKNTFIVDKSAKATCTDPTVFTNFNGWFNFRAGVGRIIDNTIPAVDLSPAWGVKAPIEFVGWVLRRASWCWTGGYPLPRETGWGYSTGGTVISTIHGVIHQDLEPIYLAGNSGGGNYNNVTVDDFTCFDAEGGGNGSCDYPNTAACLARDSALTYILADREFYNDKGSSFTGASGTGAGPRASRPATCTTGTAWWATDQGNWNTSGSAGGGSGQQGVLDLCTAPNTWTNASYTPYTYPHVLAGGVPPPPPPAPSIIPGPSGRGVLRIRRRTWGR